MKKIILTSLCLLLSAPAQALVSAHTSARPLGTGNKSIQVGYNYLTYVQGHYGVTDKLDVGLGTDVVTLDLDVNYALFHQKEGLSMALNGGVGTTFVINMPYVYIGSTLSYKLGSVEPYISARTGLMTHTLSMIEIDEKIKHTGLGQFSAGVNFICSKNMTLNAHVASVIESHTRTLSKPYLGIGMKFTF